MPDLPALKSLIWVGSSRRDLLAMRPEVRSHMGYALYMAQLGGKHADAKPLKGFGSAAVLEVVTDHSGDTFRAVYTVRLADAVYVLHVFQKKSKSGGALPKSDRELIMTRLKLAERIAKGEP